MEIKKTSQTILSPQVNLLIYGEPKVGKSTFATSAKGVLIADAEGGYKYMANMGIDVPVAKIETWEDIQEFYKEAMKPEYKTVVLDPVNELLEKLMRKAKSNGLYIQATDKNALSMKGWGYVKDQMRIMLKTFRDMDKNVIIVAHTKTIEDDGAIKKTPKLEANLSTDLMAMMDIIGYMSIVNKDHEQTRVISFKPSARFDAGDRTGALPEYFDPKLGFEKLRETVSEKAKPEFNFEKSLMADESKQDVISSSNEYDEEPKQAEPEKVDYVAKLNTLKNK